MNWTLLGVLDTIGILTFALSGATLAIKKRFDIFGVFVLAFVTAVGGGTIRDILIGLQPVSWIRDNQIIYTISAGALVALLTYRVMHKLNVFVYLFDALGLGLFTIAGIEKGLMVELNMFMCVALGTITATFGGMIRDILSGEKPMLLNRKEIYAIASVIGGFLYLLLLHFGMVAEVAAIISTLFIAALRMITHKFKIRLTAFYAGFSTEDVT